MNTITGAVRNVSAFLAVMVPLLLGPSAGAADSTLIPAGAVWQYESSGTDLGTAWRAVAYVDDGWLSGPAQLGYGDGDEATLLPASPIRPCYYFRRNFAVTDPAQFSSLSLEILADDGCVVYLNGQELARYSMPEGVITYDTWATSATDYPWRPAITLANLLVPGDNVLAVEVHQGNATSSDVSFDLRLTGRREVSVVLNEPAHLAAGVMIPATLSAVVTSPQGAPVDVTFYGRPTPIAGPDFALIMLPDIQNYTAEKLGGTKEILFSQTDWILANREAWNIAYVAQMGDISDNGDVDVDESEWRIAADAFARLRAVQLPDGIPYGLAVGNHDQMVPAGDTEPTTLYNQYFGTSHFQGRTYFGGSYGTQANNQFQLFSASGLDFLVIYLDYDPTPDLAVLNWANQLLASHPQCRGIVVSHNLLETTGAWSAQGSATYEALKANPNLFLMLCGHNTGEVRRMDEYNGRTVHTLMSDYQGWANGGGGYLRILQFSPANNVIRLQTYSTWLHTTNTASDLSLNVDLAPAQPFAVIQQNTGVTSGTTTTATWSGLEPGVSYDWFVFAADGTESGTSQLRSFTTFANRAPAVALVSPVNGSQFHNDGSSITLEAAASDPDGHGVRVEFFEGTTWIGASTGSPYTCAFTPGAGVHTVTAVATDDPGLQTISAAVTFIVEPGAPPAPTSLTAEPQSFASILLTWADNSATEQAFEILVSTGHGNTYLSAGAVPANTTSALIPGLTPLTEYYFIVQATNIDGAGPSAPVLAMTPGEPQPPVAPGSLTATAQSATSILLSWMDNSADETGFLLERSLNGLTWTPSALLGANITTLIDTGLVSGTPYYYRISALKDTVASLPSAMAAAAPFIEAFATAETTVIGTLAGDRAATFAADLVFETITEKFSGAKNTRTSALEQVWTFNLVPGASHEFFLKAAHNPTVDGESFAFAWSSDNVNYHDLVSLSAAPDSAGYRSGPIPAVVQGLIYVRVRDTDRTIGKTALDTLSIDHMFIRTDVSPVIAPPAPPVLTQAVAGDQSVALDWTPSPGATSYSVWRRAGSGDFLEAASGLSATGYTDIGLANGVTYSYFVTAENSFGASQPSAVLSATPEAPMGTEPPTGLAASGAKRKIILNWTPSTTPGVLQYEIYRSADGVSFALRATIAPAITWSESVPTGTTYWYYLRAVSSNGTSPDSNISSATAR